MGHKITNYGIKKTYTKEERLEVLKKAIELGESMINYGLEDLRYEVEMKMSSKCYRDELEAERLGVEHECTCKDPYKMNIDELKEHLDDE